MEPIQVSSLQVKELTAKEKKKLIMQKYYQEKIKGNPERYEEHKNKNITYGKIKYTTCDDYKKYMIDKASNMYYNKKNSQKMFA